MKTIKLLLTALVAVVLLAGEGCAKDHIVTFEKLPANAQNFIKKHFAEKQISLCKKDVDFSETTYEVYFNDGCSVDFNKKGEWKEVNCRVSGVPDAIIPSPILDYVKNNYPGVKIVKIDLDKRGYEIELTNRLELKFNKQFQLIDLDD